MPSFHLNNRAALKGISIFKTYQNIKQEFRKTIMINVSFESCSKMNIQPDEVSHVTTELIRLYRDHQFTKLPKLKYIVGYLPDDVSKGPSRSSRKKSTENRNENLPRME